MAEKEMRNFALRDENGNEIGVFTGKSPGHSGCGERRSCTYSQARGAGGQAQGRTGMDAGQDLEAHGQEGGCGEAGRIHGSEERQATSRTASSTFFAAEHFCALVASAAISSRSLISSYCTIRMPE